MIRLSHILRALEDHGGALDHHEGALVWIDGPDEGCYVRAGHIIRIEAYFRGKNEVWSRIILRNPDGSMLSLSDKRRPKSVRNAVVRAELTAAEIMIGALRSKLG
jgi:hypothetical protein